MSQRRVVNSSAPLSILIAGDEAGDRRQVRRALSHAGFLFECVEARTVEDTVAACETRAFDCAFIDYRMPSYNSLEGISALHSRSPLMSIIMATGDGNETVATEAMRRGASDYITKASITADSIKRVVTSALERGALWRVVAVQREGLENFASTLAHDLKAPVASIQLFVNTIAEDLHANVPDREEIFELCRTAVAAAQRAGELIDTLHRYTKADGVVVLTSVDMRLIMSGAISNLEYMIKKRGAQVTFGELPIVMGEPVLLMQILQNLIENAIKYCTTPIPRVHLSAVKDKDKNWLFSVTDNGIGIAKKNMSRIFEPFTQLHLNGKYEGSGLGLSTCRKAIQRLGGSIWVESKGEGKGSRFVFKLHQLEDLRAGAVKPPIY